MRSFLSYLLLAVVLSACAALKIGAFNIRRLSKKTVADTTVRDHLAQVLQRYDITVIEESQDEEGLNIIVNALNANGSDYQVLYSERLGRTTYKEYYAVVYNKHVNVTDHFQYPVALNQFERPPYSVLLHALNTAVTNFVITIVHTKPDDAATEIGLLVDVYDAVSEHFANENVLIGGDYNADCSYLSASKLAKNPLRTDPRFKWLIPSEADTTASTNTDCAYDRFVVAGDQLTAAVVPGSAKVYNLQTDIPLSFEQVWAMSDHYPIEVELV